MIHVAYRLAEAFLLPLNENCLIERIQRRAKHANAHHMPRDCSTRLLFVVHCTHSSVSCLRADGEGSVSSSTAQASAAMAADMAYDKLYKLVLIGDSVPSLTRHLLASCS